MWETNRSDISPWTSPVSLPLHGVWMDSTFLLSINMSVRRVIQRLNKDLTHLSQKPKAERSASGPGQPQGLTCLRWNRSLLACPNFPYSLIGKKQIYIIGKKRVDKKTTKILPTKMYVDFFLPTKIFKSFVFYCYFWRVTGIYFFVPTNILPTIINADFFYRWGIVWSQLLCELYA